MWDGAETLFDMNFLALGVDPDEAWALASRGKIYPVGKNHVCHFAEYWLDPTFVSPAAIWWGCRCARRAAVAEVGK